jgi:hypothetical protein
MGVLFLRKYIGFGNQMGKKILVEKIEKKIGKEN